MRPPAKRLPIKEIWRKVLGAIGHLNNLVGLEGLVGTLITAAGWIGTRLVHTVPSWTLLPCCLLSFIIGIAIGRVTRKSAPARGLPISPFPRIRRFTLALRGVAWHCTESLGRLRQSTPVCPGCDMEIVPRQEVHAPGSLNQPKVVLECERPGCGFRAEFLKMELSKFRSAVRREIEAEMRKAPPRGGS